MGIDAKGVVVYVRKAVTVSIETWFRSLRDHPFVWVMVFCSLLLYRLFPSLFAFLVSSSPVIVCTAVLLGTLLSFGQPNIPEVEEEEKRTQEISSLKAGVVNDDHVVQKDESVELETHVEKTSEIHTKESRDIRDGEHEVLVSRAVAVEAPHEEIHREKKVVEEREFHDQQLIEKREFHEETTAEGVAEAGEAVENQSGENRNSLKVKIDKPVGNVVDTHLDGRFDSSLGSPWNAIDDHDGASDSDSDGSESSSPDASMSEIMPMLDELHPLLDAETHKPAHASVIAPDAMSQGSSSDHELEASSNEGSDDGSAELVEKAENQVEEEAQEDRTTVVVKWTEDDEKNLKDLGTSEIERNQRLENLIAKRIARKQRVETEKNLIDLDSNEPADPAQVGNSIPEELSRLQVLIPSFTTTKRSPFDLPYDSPVPVSAPSVLQPRKNPFDLPDDQDSERSIPTGVNLGQQQFLTAQQRDMFFRRHESFALGASFLGEVKQAKHDSRFKPYFVPEEINCPTYQRQSSEKSDSKVSSVPETDASSVVDQEDRKELSEQELRLEGEPISPTNLAAKLVEQESQSSEEANSVDTEQDQSDDGGEVLEMGCDASISNTINQDNSASERMKPSMEHDSRKVGADVKEQYKESISSSEVNEKNFETNTDEGSGSRGPMGIDSSKWSNESVQSTIADPDILSRDVDGVDGGRAVEPVYDSSPSATEKSLSNLTSGEDDLFCARKGILCFTSSMASDMHGDVSGGGLSPMLVVASSLAKDGESTSIDGNAKEEIASSNERPWVASPNLSAVDENELRSNEVSAISEIDVIQAGFAGVCQSHDDSTTPASPLEQVFPESTLCSSETKVMADGPMSKEENDLSLEARVNNKETQDLTAEGINNQRIITEEDDEADRIKDDDEAMLSELETAGDFRVDGLRSDASEAKKKLHSDAQLGEISATSVTVPLVHTRVRESFSELQVLEARSVEDIDIALRLVSEGIQSKSTDSQLAEDKAQTMISEVGSFESEPADRGQWVEESSSGLQDLEASNVTDLDLGFKQLHEGEVERPIAAESIENKLMAIKTEDGVSNPVEINPELQVIEVRSLEDIDSALKQLHKGDLLKSASLESVGVKLVEAEAVSPALTQDEKHYEPNNVDSDLQVVEASSGEDFHSAPKPLADGNVNEQLKPMQAEDRSVEPEATEKHIEPVTVPVLAAPKEPIAAEDDMITEELSAENSNNKVKEKSDELSSSPQLFSKRKGKAASGKSSPNSRSSSSSSDSD